MKKLVWLVSYPKSGNTWVRLFLEAYLHPERALDINTIDISQHAGNRILFDQVTGIEASDMTPAEIDRYRPDVYRQLAMETKEPLFIKVHDRWRDNIDGQPIFPEEITAATIYIARDPRSVAPSYAHHYQLSIDEAIEKMAAVDQDLASQADRLSEQLPQPMGSWSQHVSAWLDQTELPVYLVRYEDLHAAPLSAFGAILQAAGLTMDQNLLNAALAQSNFDRLRLQETKQGFRERPTAASCFFRRGQTESWREELTTAQIKRITDDHGAVMRRLSYFDA